MEKQNIKSRTEIAKEDRWALEDLYTNDECWKADYEKLQQMIPEVTSFRGRLGESAEVLLQMQKKVDQANMLAEKVYVYAGQKLHEDMDCGESQNLSSMAQALLVRLEEACAYIEPELMELPEGTVEGFLRENKELQEYRQYFENLMRGRKHVLSGEMEELLAASGELAEGPGDIFAMFNNADIRFPQITGEDGTLTELTQGRYLSFLQSQDRRVRKEAFEALYGTYGKYRNTLAAVYRANVKKEVFYAKVRKYGSDLEAALYQSNIPVSVYENLIQAVHEALPLMHRYVELRKRLLGTEELHMYDLYVPIIAVEDQKWRDLHLWGKSIRRF